MRKLVAVGAIVIFIYGMLASMLGTIVASLGAALALDNLQQSYLALAQGVGLAATSVWSGAFMDRQGKKPGIVLGLVVAIVGLALLSHPSSLGLAILAMALLGVGGSLVIVGANALVNDVSQTGRARALNVLNLFVGLGGMATPLVAGNLLHADGQRVAYFGMAIGLLALTATLLAPIPKPAPRTSRSGGGSIFSAPLLYGLSAITFLYTACEFSMWNWLPKFLVASGVGQVTALNILSLGFACGLLFGRLIAAMFLARFSPAPVVLACAVAMAVTTWATLHASGASLVGGLVFLTGLAMAPVFPNTVAIIGGLFTARSGAAIGFAITCGFSGLVVSSPLIGLLSGGAADGIGRALRLIPVFSIAIAGILVVLRRRLSAAATAA